MRKLYSTFSNQTLIAWFFLLFDFVLSIYNVILLYAVCNWQLTIIKQEPHLTLHHGVAHLSHCPIHNKTGCEWVELHITYLFRECTLITLLAWSLRAFIYQFYHITLLLVFIFCAKWPTAEKLQKYQKWAPNWVFSEIFSVVSWFDKMTIQRFCKRYICICICNGLNASSLSLTLSHATFNVIEHLLIKWLIVAL